MLDRLKIKPKLDIELDNRKLEFRVGDFSLPVVNIKKVPEKEIKLKGKILAENNYADIPDLSSEVGYKEIHEYICGVLGPRFNTALSYACFNNWIKPNRDTIFKYYLQNKYTCPYTGYYKRFFLNNDQIRRYYYHKNLVDEVIKDGLHNIVPLVTFFGLSPCQLKKKFGKGLWRKITKKSISFNRGLISHLAYIYPEKSRLNPIDNTDLSRNQIRVLTSIKSTLVTEYRDWFDPNKYGRDHTLILNLLEYLSKCKVSCKSSLNNCKHIYHDTYRMAERLGLKFNKDWSVNRVNEEHQRMTQLSNAGFYADTVYPCLKKHVDVMDDKHFKNFHVKLIVTPYQLKQEGLEMHHCVSIYDFPISKMGYLVFFTD